MSLSNLRRYFIVLFLIVPALSFASQQNINAKIVRVSDGDTVVVQPAEGGAFMKCRLYGIDSPEIPHGRKEGQPFGEDATKALKRLVLAQDTTIEVMDKDRYGRSVCRIYKNRLDVNLEMVKEGYAWAYIQYLKRPHASEYIDAEREARAKKLGLWQQSNPLPPWEFRKLMRKK